MSKTPKPLLIFGYGNPGRGDDGLGPAFLEGVEHLILSQFEHKTERRIAPQIELQSDMQLQVEHVMDMQGRELVLFVDADMACESPFELSEIAAAKDDSYTSHAMSPQALLHAYPQIYRALPPPTFLLRIRGETFELGDELSPAAHAHLQAALVQLRPLLADLHPESWRAFTAREAV